MTALSQRSKREGWLLWTLVFLASCRFEASCGSNDNLLNTKKGERVIAEWLEKQGMAAESVSCPHDIKIEKDSQFQCRALIAKSGGLEIPVLVVLTSDDGDITMSHVTKVQATESVERGIGGQIFDQTKEKVTVDCGLRARVNQAGSTFKCKVSGPKESFEAEVTIKDPNVDGDWSMKRL